MFKSMKRINCERAQAQASESTKSSIQEEEKDLNAVEGSEPTKPFCSIVSDSFQLCRLYGIYICESYLLKRSKTNSMLFITNREQHINIRQIEIRLTIETSTRIM